MPVSPASSSTASCPAIPACRPSSSVIGLASGASWRRIAEDLADHHRDLLGRLRHRKGSSPRRWPRLRRRRPAAVHAPAHCRGPAWSASGGQRRQAARPATPPESRTPRQQSASHRAAFRDLRPIPGSDSQGNSDFRKITCNLSLTFAAFGGTGQGQANRVLASRRLRGAGALSWASQCSSGRPDRKLSRLNLRIRRWRADRRARSPLAPEPSRVLLERWLALRSRSGPR